MKKLFLILIATLVLWSCSNEPTIPNTKYYRPGKGIFVCNEGNFNGGNASLSYYNPADGKIENEVFYGANDIPLGDVAQSMNIINGRGYVVVNNSGKIMVVDVNTFEYKGVIDGFVSPRYIVPINNKKAYVSSMYSPSVAIVDLTTNKVTGSVYLGTNSNMGKVNSSEQMIVSGKYLYVASYSYNNKIYKIDTSNDKLVDSLTVTKQPNSMVVDKNNKLWVLSDGGYMESPYGQEMAALTRVDLTTFAIEDVLKFSHIGLSPTSLCANLAKDRLYFISTAWVPTDVSFGVYRMEIIDNAIPRAPLIPQGTASFYGLGVDPQNGDIYVSDANGYWQNGKLLRYQAGGELISSSDVKMMPNGICFKTK